MSVTFNQDGDHDLFATVKGLRKGAPTINGVAVPGALATLASDFNGDHLSVKMFGAVGDGTTDDTAAIQAAISAAGDAGRSLLFPGGTYLTSGNHTLPPGMILYGDGMGRTTIKHTATSGYLFRCGTNPNETSIILWGGEVRDMTLLGVSAGDDTTAVYIKNAIKLPFNRVEIKQFGYAFRGARDAVTNAVVDFSLSDCRLLGNGFGVYGPCQWDHGCIRSSQLSNLNWDVVVYDSTSFTLQSGEKTFGATEAGAGKVFFGGCSAVVIDGVYFEGDPPLGAYVKITKNKDITGATSNNGFALQEGHAGSIRGCNFASAAGTPYGILLDGASHIEICGCRAGSGIQTALVRLTSGTIRNVMLGNFPNPGAVASYETAADLEWNVELDMYSIFQMLRAYRGSFGGAGGLPPAGHIVLHSGGDTGHIFFDGDRDNDVAALKVNEYGYQGGKTRYRDTHVLDGRGNFLMQIAAALRRLDLCSSHIYLSQTSSNLAPFGLSRTSGGYLQINAGTAGIKFRNSGDTADLAVFNDDGTIDTPPIYANNAAAIAGGLTAGKRYRTGGDPDVLCIVH